MYNTTHSFMTKGNIPVVNSSFNHNQSFNMSTNIGTVQGQDKKMKKYSNNSRKHVKQGAYSSYTNMTKKHPRANSNNDAVYVTNIKPDDYMNKSIQKKNILFKLTSELSQSPDTAKVRKAYGKDGSSNKGREDVKSNIFQRVVPHFGFADDWSGNRMNTEVTDDASLNSERNKSKPKQFMSTNDWNDIPTITLDENKTPNSKGDQTITYNNEFDNYNKSRNDDAITWKRDWLKYSNVPDSNGNRENLVKNIENRLKKKANYLNSSNENGICDENTLPLERQISNYDRYFKEAAAPLEEFARNNPTISSLISVIRKGYEEACQQIINEERFKSSISNNNTYKFKEEATIMRREKDLIQKEKENLEKEVVRNYNLFKKAKDEITELKQTIKEIKQENKALHAQSSKFKDNERKYRKLEAENKELKLILDEVKKNDFDILK